MKTFKDIQDYIEAIYNDTSQSTNVQTWINDKYKEILAWTGWDFAEKTTTDTTVASQANYTMPANYRKFISLKVTVGGVDYFPEPIADEDMWNIINSGSLSNYTSDIPEWYFIDGSEYKIYPTPSSSSNTITLKYYQRARDLVSTDFTDNTTGTVAITTGTKAVTGSGTTFLSTDAGRYLRSDDDGFWYHIASFASTTSIALTRDLEGANVSGSSFKIGTLPFGFGNNTIPEEGQLAIAYGVLMDLYEKREDMSVSGGRANYYRNKYEAAIKLLRKQRKELFGSPTVSKPRTSRQGLPNPNNYPLGLST